MSMSPNTGYSAVSAADDDGIGLQLAGRVAATPAEKNCAYADERGDEATQSPELELQQDRHETRRKERGLRCKLLTTACLLALTVVGGREYYVRSGGGSVDGDARTGVTGDDPSKLFGHSIRGSDDRGSVDEDPSPSEEIPINEAPVTSLVMVEEEGGEVEGEEGEGGEIAEEGGVELEEKEGEGGELVAEKGEQKGKQEEEEEKKGDLNEVEEKGEELDLEKVVEAEPETTEVEIVEDTENLVDDEDGNSDSVAASEGEAEEEGVSPGEENHSLPQQEGVPDYFVPLTPAEREQLRERLRATMRKTRDALHLSATLDGFIDFAHQRTLVLNPEMPKSFMHMHHMKTGGTSLDGLINCALRRQATINNGTKIKYTRMSECGAGVRSCMDNLAKQLNATVKDNVFYHNDAQGNPWVDAGTSFEPASAALGLPINDFNVCGTSEASVMSYCASLHAVSTFGWHDVDKVTVIRHPVDRAWSMYRFSLQRCYKCLELKDVLRRVANGTHHAVPRGAGKEHSVDAKGPNFVYDPNDSCAVQMIGHQATNLLTSVELYRAASDVRFPREKEIAEEAVRNLREVFTWIGITDKIEESVEGIRAVFPFLSESLKDAAEAIESGPRERGEPISGLLPGEYDDQKGCPFEHKNGGREPTCGTKELDDETIHLINTLTARDMAVYQAAVERFALQNEVLEEYRNGSL